MPLLENAVIDWVGDAWQPTNQNIYASLHTAAAAAPSNELEAATATGYARSGGSSMTYVTGSPRQLRQSVLMSFPIAGAAWPQVRAVGFSRGNVRGQTLLGYATLASPLTVAANDRLSIPVNALRVDITSLGAFLTEAGLVAALRQGLRSLLGGGYIGLHSGEATPANEISGGGYTRSALLAGRVLRTVYGGSLTVAGRTLRATVASPPSSALQENIGIPWSGALANPSWSAPTHWGLWSSQSGGTLYGKGAISPAAPSPPAAGFYFATKGQILTIETPFPSQS